MSFDPQRGQTTPFGQRILAKYSSHLICVENSLRASTSDLILFISDHPLVLY